MIKIAQVLSLLTLALAVTSTNLWAAEVRLVIWVGDKGPLNEDSFNAEMAQLDAANAMETRVLRTTATDATKDVAEKLPKLFSLNDRVSNIVLATHGTVSSFRNFTQLLGMGGYGPKGVTGNFRVALETLSSLKVLNDDVHVYMMSCSNLRGSPAKATARADGLIKTLFSLGVRRASVWGARQDLTAPRYRDVTARTLRVNYLRESYYPRVLLASLAWLAAYYQVRGYLSGQDIVSAAAINGVGFSLWNMAKTWRETATMDRTGGGLLVSKDRAGGTVEPVDLRGDATRARFRRCENGLRN